MAKPGAHETGVRVFECAECHQRTRFTRQRLARRARPTCKFCGSPCIDPVSKEGQDDVKERATRLVVGEPNLTTPDELAGGW